jgi:hypothetical protein
MCFLSLHAPRLHLSSFECVPRHDGSLLSAMPCCCWGRIILHKFCLVEQNLLPILGSTVGGNSSAVASNPSSAPKSHFPRVGRTVLPFCRMTQSFWVLLHLQSEPIACSPTFSFLACSRFCNVAASSALSAFALTLPKHLNLSTISIGFLLAVNATSFFQLPMFLLPSRRLSALFGRLMTCSNLSSGHAAVCTSGKLFFLLGCNCVLQMPLLGENGLSACFDHHASQNN